MPLLLFSPYPGTCGYTSPQIKCSYHLYHHHTNLHFLTLFSLTIIIDLSCSCQIMNHINKSNVKRGDVMWLPLVAMRHPRWNNYADYTSWWICVDLLTFCHWMTQSPCTHAHVCVCLHVPQHLHQAFTVKQMCVCVCYNVALTVFTQLLLLRVCVYSGQWYYCVCLCVCHSGVYRAPTELQSPSLN